MRLTTGLERSSSLELLRQLASFGMVGVCATLCHAAVAWLSLEGFGANAYLANFLGVACAFWISFFGNAIVTFRVKTAWARAFRRTLALAALSFVVSTAELALVRAAGLADAVYILLMIVTVPPANFVAAKLWAYAGTGHRAPPRAAAGNEGVSAVAVGDARQS